MSLIYNKNTGTHWIVIFVKSNEVIFFDSFGVEYIPKEIMEKIEYGSLGNQNIKNDGNKKFRMQNIPQRSKQL